MTSFDRLDAYLARDFNADYWYDDAFRLAAQWIAGFGPADWASLRAHAPDRPAAWQGRCAYALVGTPAAESADLLLQMASSDDDDAAAAAVATLATLKWDGLRPLLTPVLDERLSRLGGTRPMASHAIGWLHEHAHQTDGRQ
jgi:hypothetical protein